MPTADGKLGEPPIIEVVCGVAFKSIRELDPISLGQFWLKHREHWPRREFKMPVAPATVEGVAFSVGPDLGPIRTWLVSKSDDFILQVQHDRFYLNWRVRQGEYPRFTTRDGKDGLLARFMTELNNLSDFTRSTLGCELEIETVELAKLDRLIQGRHWKGTQDLTRLLPMLATTLELASGGDPTIQVRISTPVESGRIDVSVEEQILPSSRALKLDFRSQRFGVFQLADVERVMKESNDTLNGLFTKLVPEQHRFEKNWRPQ